MVKCVVGPPMVDFAGVSIIASVRLAIETTLFIVNKSIEGMCGKQAIFSLDARGGPDPASAAGFAVAIGGGAKDAEFIIILDMAAARALASAVTANIAGIRGVGDLTEAERGVIEYIFLECFDLLQKEDKRLSRNVNIRKFLGEKEIADELRRKRFSGMTYALSIGRESGYCYIWTPSAISKPGISANALSRPASHAARLAVALPTVTLSEEDAKLLRPGDVVLLGCSSLGQLRAPAALVASSGWRLADASIQDKNNPGLNNISIRTDAWSPVVFDLPEAPAGFVTVLPFLGVLSASAEQLRSWWAGGSFELPMETPGAVTLQIGTGIVRHGEIVFEESTGLLGARILK